LERMVLDVHRQPLHAGIEAGTFRHGPALEHPVDLQSEIVVQVAGGVLLDAEHPAAPRADWTFLCPGAAAWLGGLFEIAFLAVTYQRHEIALEQPGGFRTSDAPVQGNYYAT